MNAVADAVIRARSGFKEPERSIALPRDILPMFPSPGHEIISPGEFRFLERIGLGKTEVARPLAEPLFVCINIQRAVPARVAPESLVESDPARPRRDSQTVS